MDTRSFYTTTCSSLVMSNALSIIVFIWLSLCKVTLSCGPSGGWSVTTTNAPVIESNSNSADSRVLFQSGEEYALFRLPAIVFHQNTFLAFCEGRMGKADSSVSDIVMKRGILDGKEVIWDKTVTVIATIQDTRLANPVPVIDTDTDMVFLLYNVLLPGVELDTFLQQDRYNQTLLLIQSTDLGLTWSKPQDITNQTLGDTNPVPVFYAPGPGHGIQMKSGRLVLQGNFYYKDIDPSHKLYKYGTSDHSTVFLSDNHGQDWGSGGYVPYGEDDKGSPIHNCESTVVELADNTLCINSRTLDKRQPRSQSFSSDGGETFGEPELADTLIEPQNIGTFPGCAGSVLGFQPPSPQNSRFNQPWVLFSNPADKLIRFKMSIRLSKDGCLTWSKPWTIWPLASGYSDLVQVQTSNLLNPTFAILYERGVTDSTTVVSFKMFTLTDVLNGIKKTVGVP